jgi:ribosomal protein S18 acetylase RimI-like enzyme
MSRDFIEYGLGWRWTEQRVARALRDDSTNVVVVRDGSVLTAFGIMEYGETCAHLNLLCVRPQQRRQGVASAIVAWLEKCADVAGNERIILEARTDNPGALEFYRRHGYAVTRTLPGYYLGRLDAVRLEKRLWVAGTARP